jgi:hypothetical protein
MTIEEAFALINNLDMREPLRRYGPKWSTVFVSRSGEILGVHRHKDLLEKSQAGREDAEQHPPGTFYFIARPGMYPTLEALTGKVNDCVEGYEMEAEVKAKPKRKWFGKTLVLGRRD